MQEYIRHSQLVKHLDAALKLREAMIEKKIEIMEQMLPKGFDFSREKVQNSGGINPFDRYLEALEKAGIDDKVLSESKTIVDELFEMVQLSEREIRKSGHTYDRFYVMKVIEKRPMWQVEKRMNYSHAQAWRIWKIIKKNL